MQSADNLKLFNTEGGFSVMVLDLYHESRHSGGCLEISCASLLHWSFFITASRTLLLGSQLFRPAYVPGALKELSFGPYLPCFQVGQ